MRILCIASGGGHLEQLLACLDALEGHELALAVYGFHSQGFKHPRFARQFRIFRGGDHLWLLLLGTILTVFQWAWILARFRPDVILSTGAELAIVPFYLGRGLCGARCIFLESAEYQTSPTRTGRWIYPACNTFFVQSEVLLRHYGPKARYGGTLL